MKVFVYWNNLTILKKLKYKYIFFRIPFSLLKLPVLLVCIFLDRLALITEDISYKSCIFYDWWDSKTEPPKWYISNKHTKEAKEIKKQIEEENRNRILQKLKENK